MMVYEMSGREYVNSGGTAEAIELLSRQLLRQRLFYLHSFRLPHLFLISCNKYGKEMIEMAKIPHRLLFNRGADAETMV